MTKTVIKEITSEQKYVVLDVLSKFRVISSLAKKSFGGALYARKKPINLEKKDLINAAKSITAALKAIVPSITAKINRMISQPQFEARYTEFYNSLSSAAKTMSDLQDYYEYISVHNGEIPQDTFLGKAKNLFGIGKNIKRLSEYNDKKILDSFEEVEEKLQYTLGKIEQ